MTEKPANTPLEGLTLTQPAVQAAKKVEPKCGFHWGTGRRKTSVARVRIKPGKGELKINNKELAKYFTRPQDIGNVTAPLKTTNTEKSLDVFANVKGGGTTGQSGAVMLGIARALKNYDPNLTQALRDAGLLTRDGRMVERKKPGQSGARRRFQFSKR
ncbi:MAG: 30S ribosomal protein S9 [Planctomycetes bacterium HGW-Planctomycetes-1]|nr:MAG: 30S ribosomal protein S9 [Planctomycetes bacterium HGW-Planctomycetes-1]